MIGWLALGTIIYLYSAGSLTFWSFLGVLAVAFVAKAVVVWPSVRAGHEAARADALEKEKQHTEERPSEPPPVATAHVKLSTLVALRNLLLAHHNARHLESGYAQSRTAAQTNDTIAVLNDYLDKRT